MNANGQIIYSPNEITQISRKANYRHIGTDVGKTYKGSTWMVSVTKFGEISSLWQKIKSLDNFWYGLISIGQTFLPTSTIFTELSKFSFASKWRKIEK